MCAFTCFQRNSGDIFWKLLDQVIYGAPLDLYLYTWPETIEIKTVFLPANVCMLSDKGKHLWGVFSQLVLNQCTRSNFNCSFSDLGFIPMQNIPRD